TNLTQDHLDLHGDMSEYFQAKATLFKDNHSAVRVITLNGGAEPDWGEQLAEQVPDAITLDLGPAAPTDRQPQHATWRVTTIEPAGLGHRFTLHHESGMTVTTRAGMPGNSNIATAALAAATVSSGPAPHTWAPISTA